MTYKSTLEKIEILISFFKTHNKPNLAEFWLEQLGRTKATKSFKNFPIQKLVVHLNALELHKQRSKKKALDRDQATFFAFYR